MLGTFYVFTLSTDSGAVANATIPVTSYEDTMQTTATAPIRKKYSKNNLNRNF